MRSVLYSGLRDKRKVSEQVETPATQIQGQAAGPKRMHATRLCALFALAAYLQREDSMIDSVLNQIATRAQQHTLSAKNLARKPTELRVIVDFFRKHLALIEHRFSTAIVAVDDGASL